MDARIAPAFLKVASGWDAGELRNVHTDARGKALVTMLVSSGIPCKV